jgi:hypothetical protein
MSRDGEADDQGSPACPLWAWAGLGGLAAYAAVALLIGGCILAGRDA